MLVLNTKYQTQQSYTFSYRSMPPLGQSQLKSVPAQPGKRNFKNAPRATEKKNKYNEMDRQMQNSGWHGIQKNKKKKARCPNN